MAVRSAHVVFATVGSLGDLYPFLAIGQQLRERGHRVTVASHGLHRAAVAQAGLGFAEASGIAEPADKAAFMARAFDPWRGPGFVVGELAAADVEASYQRLLPLTRQADVLVTSTLAFAAQIIGERDSAAGRMRWLSAVLAPAGLLSVRQPPALGVERLDRWLAGAPWRGRAMLALARFYTRRWTAPVRQLRRRLGLPAEPPGGDPFHYGQFSPQGTLALFPDWLAPPREDWPTRMQALGFARYPQPGSLPPALAAFLAAGPAPLVFTLGSAVVHAGAGFLRQSVQAARMLGQRAVLLTGSAALSAQLSDTLGEDVLAWDYAPHAALFARARAVIHHGGIGTSAEALHAGLPQLVVPHAFDQFDNALRLRQLGVAAYLPATRYRADRAADRLAMLLQPSVAQRSAEWARRLAGSDGAASAAQWIEQQLRSG